MSTPTTLTPCLSLLESGPAANVREAIEVLDAERIGHGYNVLSDPEIYILAKDARVHFEASIDVCSPAKLYCYLLLNRLVYPQVSTPMLQKWKTTL